MWVEIKYERRCVCFSTVGPLLTPDNYSLTLLLQITAISPQTVVMRLNHPCEGLEFT